MSNFRHSTCRDFRIQSDMLNEVLEASLNEEAEDHDEEEEDDDGRGEA